MPLSAHPRQEALVARLRQAGGRPVPEDVLRRYVQQHSTMPDHNRGYSRRTLQRDLGQLPEHFGVVVKSRRNEGHYIADTEALPLAQQRLNEALALRAFYALPEALGPFVQPEARQPLGLDHLRPLLQAVQTRQLVEFDYHKHWETTPTRRRVGPLLLKEFRGRWYVLATKPDTGELRCFGLDRLGGLLLTGEAFEAPAGFDAATYYAHAFGIIRPDEPGAAPTEVVLSFEPTQGRYALSYPLHPSQEVLVANAQEIRLRLKVFDTYELRLELLGYGQYVQALAPPALRAWLHEQHGAAASQAL